MPPRRMGSISVVVVFSSRLSFFSGGPEPPSPAARLLPGPDMAAAAKRGAGSPEGSQAGEGCTPVTCRRQSAKMWRRPELRNHATLPHLPEGPRPAGPEPLTGSRISPRAPSWTPPDVTGLPSRAQAPGAVPDVAKSSSFPVSIGLALSRLSGLYGFLSEPSSLRDWSVNSSHGNR